MCHLAFKGVNGGDFFQSQTDIIQPVDQAMFAMLIDVKGDHLTIGCLNALVFEIDHHARIAAFLGVFHQQLQLIFGHNHRQDTIFEAIVVKDICKAGRDHAADAEIQQGPRRMLARRAAPKVVAGDQNIDTFIGIFVEHEIWIVRSVQIVAHLMKCADPKAGAFDGF